MKKPQRPTEAELLGKKNPYFNSKHPINKKVFYKIEVDFKLMRWPVIAMYFSGNDFCCDPRRTSLPKNTKPRYSVYHALKRRACVRDGLKKSFTVGYALVGSNPVCQDLSKVLFYTNDRPTIIFTDGSNLETNRWTNRVSHVGLIIKHSSEVDYLQTYYESMIYKMDQIGGHIKNKTLVARYTKKTKKEILETANILAGMRSDWKIVEFNCGS